MNVTSSLERHYARSTFLVAGVGVLITGNGPDTTADVTVAAAETASFTDALDTASAAQRPDSDTGRRPEHCLAVA